MSKTFKEEFTSLLELNSPRLAENLISYGDRWENYYCGGYIDEQGYNIQHLECVRFSFRSSMGQVNQAVLLREPKTCKCCGITILSSKTIPMHGFSIEELVNNHIEICKSTLAKLEMDYQQQKNKLESDISAYRKLLYPE